MPVTRSCISYLQGEGAQAGAVTVGEGQEELLQVQVPPSEPTTTRGAILALLAVMSMIEHRRTWYSMRKWRAGAEEHGTA